MNFWCGVSFLLRCLWLRVRFVLRLLVMLCFVMMYGFIASCFNSVDLHAFNDLLCIVICLQTCCFWLLLFSVYLVVVVF